uniref:C3H1-type domain-containing protein n=1 Tax=Trypanosoma congolense (strain IL3000) TaxID=1068625 RepID=G0UKI0_TRYCI|nr:conserved hypothetical protein [Trypanosoma congolense IL3000]
MGRAKGRGKNFDVTNKLFQPGSAVGRIAVQLSPSHFTSVAEDEISPTNGSRVAFAMMREGRMDVAVSVCHNWRHGTCSNQASCNSIHILGHHNQLPVAGAMHLNNFAPVSTPMLGARDNSENSVSPVNRQHQRQPSQQLPMTQIEPNRMVEHKNPNSSTNSMTGHGTLIPAPRSQQNNRNSYAANKGSAGTNFLNSNSSWGRDPTGLDGQFGGQHQFHAEQQQRQQQEQMAAQGRGAWNVQRTSVESRRQASGVMRNELQHDGTAYRNKGKGDGSRKRGSNNVVHGFSASNSLDRGMVQRSTPCESPCGPHADDTWTTPTAINQSNGASVIWGDEGIPAWDLASTDVTSQGTVSQARGNPAHVGEMADPLLRPSSAELWSTLVSNSRDRATKNNGGNSNSSNSFAVANGDANNGNVNRYHHNSDSSVGRVVGAQTSSEALTSQLLLHLVGGGVEADESHPPFPESTYVRVKSGSAVSAATTDPPLAGAQARSSLESMGLLGSGGTQRKLTRSSPSPQVPSQQDSAPVVERLMALLTIE